MRRNFLLALMLVVTMSVAAQRIVHGTVTERDGKTPVEFATVAMLTTDQWCMTDLQGAFALPIGNADKVHLRVSCVGYETVDTLLATRNLSEPLHLLLNPLNLQIAQVVVTAQRKTENATTSYVVDRQALDNQQIINVSDIMTLLPGGKTVNSSLINDQRIALRAGDSEKGNAAFGTAVEVDGQRLQNNAELGETTSASTRTIASTNVASIEVVPGIPSVEYGDLSNGIVKVNTKRGHTPWEVSLGTNPHTWQVAVSKGFDLRHGVLNASLEHTRSFSSLASPHTAYQRNTLSLNWQNTLQLAGRPLLLNVNLGGNVGGFNSKADPDQFVDTYNKSRDRVLRGGLRLDWNLNRSWLDNLSLQGDFSVADKLRTVNINNNSSSSQAQIHALQEGYYIATDYDTDPDAPVILGPTGYWYEKSYRDNKPQSVMLKLKAKWNQQRGTVTNRVMAGAEWTATGNNGRGLYYDDMRVAPTWREYRYDQLPWMHNIALYAEDRLLITTNDHGGELSLTAGLRADITRISKSDYGTVSSLSPRFNAKYTLWRGRHDWALSGLSVYGGWGKSVKLPSFEVLYPTPSYADRLAFVPGSTADNRVFYAYSVVPFKAQTNPNLKWQYAQQLELGVEADLHVAMLSVGGFFTRTHRPYLRTSVYVPYSYNFTSQAALEGDFPIASADRLYDIDHSTGVVTVTDRTGRVAPQTLPYVTRNTFRANSTYVNGSTIYRSGLDCTLDFKQIEALRTTLRPQEFYSSFQLPHFVEEF